MAKYRDSGQGTLSTDPDTLGASRGQIAKGRLDGMDILVLNIYRHKQDSFRWCINRNVALAVREHIDRFLLETEDSE